ncbi:MAG: peptidase T [Prevotellaceae bacterium]|nr:peptidase T [Prevotellaceae bacterium]
MELVERFLRYVSFDTQSSEETSGRCPSTERQMALSEHLFRELQSLGLEDVEMDSHGYVYATLPQNTTKQVPTIGFIAHIDTSPDCQGRDIKPRIIENYDGGDIQLSEGVTTTVEQFPELLRHKGETLIVTDGRTLLGADDKAGVAEIVTAMERLKAHTEIPHGKVRVAFNPDEEIGGGARLFDVRRFGCQWAYTMDGGEAGELEYENFNACQARVTIRGASVHPGYAKGRMLNASLLASEFALSLPKDERPETTEGYEGFYHLCSVRATVEEAELTYIIRDHADSLFRGRKQAIARLAESLSLKYGEGTVTVTLKDQYRNMLSQLKGKPHVTDIARQAIEEACGSCSVVPIRGGTDGAQLSFRGLPCPNIFAGGLFFHGPHELVPVESMEKAVETIVNICRITEERA